ncbi:hypothetical protein [Micromonospora sp. RP3T]|uniref:hypothetical protein n=1 Tax=Micromonospora sp. RP3T TaxID=2135446 RepID=UPI000D17075C|nr:hypothetical protein [Micromonospora sp. RP3T]PTA43963.1 hypothetical protein C8054_22685 [Micromonospora sp. RP3T]
MGTTDPGSAREEAERLVVTLLATARMAAASSGAGGRGPLGGILSGVLGHIPTGTGTGFATGSPECCVCPVCRGIAALRDPSPEFAERLATGAGDLAAGVASLLRAFAPAEPAGPATPADPPAPAASTGSGSPAPTGSGDHVWREATRTGHDSQPAPEQDVWSAATRGEGAADPGASDGSGSRRGGRHAEPEPSQPPVDAAGPAGPAASRPPAGRPTVPASRAPDETGADADPPGDGA